MCRAEGRGLEGEWRGACMQSFTTARLLLRPFELTDAPTIEALAGDEEVARTTNLPHPYPPGSASHWIMAGHEAAARGLRYPFAIVRNIDHQLVGAMTLLMAPEHRRAELGYWIGRPYWGQGYATETARRVTAHAFDDLGVNKVTGRALHYNRASTRVMEKVGMFHEGTLRQDIYHWDAFEDIDVYGLLRTEYVAQRQGTPAS